MNPKQCSDTQEHWFDSRPRMTHLSNRAVATFWPRSEALRLSLRCRPEECLRKLRTVFSMWPRVAVPTSLTIASENKISALNDGFTPANSLDRSHSHYAIWAEPSAGKPTSWVQYEWSEPVNVNKVEIYWAV